MNAQEIIAKADRGEGLTEEEIRVYREAVKPVKHTYGKYGTLAKKYLDQDERYKRTGNFMEDYRRQTEIQRLTWFRTARPPDGLEEEILSELVYVD